MILKLKNNEYSVVNELNDFYNIVRDRLGEEFTNYIQLEIENRDDCIENLKDCLIVKNSNNN